MAKASGRTAAGKASGRAPAPPVADVAPAPRVAGAEAVVTAAVTDPAPGAADNKRLAFLEAQEEMLVAFLSGKPDGYAVIEGERTADALIRIVTNQADAFRQVLEDEKAALAVAESARAAITALYDGLKDCPDFDYAPADGGPAAAVVDSALALVAKLDGLLADAGEVIAALTADPAQAAQIEAQKAHRKAERGEVAVLADLPEAAALTLRFAEDDDRFIPGIPPRTIERRQLTAIGGRGLLDLTIDFPPDLPPALIRSAWLIAGAKSVKCEISGGLRVGGGNMARIPAGHLIF